jgi:hypothetical protein
MSARTSATAYFTRGAPDLSGVYADSATTFPISRSYSIKGLCYRHANDAVAFQGLCAYSRRYTAPSKYFFYGANTAGQWSFDPKAGTSDNFGANQPPLTTWFQWAMRVDDITLRVAEAYWKLIADSSWKKVSTNLASVGDVNWTPGRFFLGADEYSANGRHYSLSNVAVWTVVKSDAVLLTEANSAAVIDTANLWAWWKMKPGLLATDSSPNARHLTAVGGPVAGADSPLEAPADGAAGATAVSALPRSLAIGMGVRL